MKTQDKIKAIEERIEKWTFVIDDNVPPEFHVLRDRCIYILSLASELLDIIIGMASSYKINETLTLEDRTKISERIEIITSPMNFDRKLQIAWKQKYIKREFHEALEKGIFLRNALSHPMTPKYSSYIEKLKKDKSELLNEWINLERITQIMNNLEKHIYE